ncbi:MAG: lamin tail domain-containing protein [Patescibacteria group bacterium]|nr:lamin tail domain-containing protein [Patescibacteria group bacterium]
MQHLYKKYLFLACLPALACFFMCGRASASTGHLVISQVRVGVSGASDNEFVELYNPTDSDVDLSILPLKLHICSSSGTDSNKALTLINKTIASRGYFLITSATSTPNGYDGILEPDATYSFSGNMLVSNGGLYISTATAADSDFIDRLGWGISSCFEGVAVASSTSNLVLARKFANGEAIDTDNNAEDFTLIGANPHNSSMIAAADLNIPEENSEQDNFGEDPGNYGTDQEENSGQNASTSWDSFLGAVVISEIVPNPSGTDEGNEAVELYNASTSAVNLDGWFLDGLLDDSSHDKAYPLAGLDIAPGEYLAVVIPEGYFKFYNSSSANSGDSAVLLFPDKTEADSVAYGFPAPDGKSWQNVEGVWMWAPLTLGLPNAAPPPPTSGGSGGGSAVGTVIPADQAVTATTVSITEFMPDPVGGDEGNEWVELYNSGSKAVNLGGWMLDSGNTSGSPGANAFTFATSVSISAKKYLTVAVPKGYFVLGNSQGSLRLLRPDKTLAQTVAYSGAPEGESYNACKNGNWSFGWPTPGAVNACVEPLADIVISELLPNPDGDEEFVEFFNASGTSASLEGYKLAIGSRGTVLENANLASSSYYALYEEDLPVNLRNSGQTVALYDNFGRMLSEVTYGPAAKGQAYALSEGSYFWTSQPTPGKSNQIILSANTEKASAVKSPDTKSGATVTDQKLLKQILAENENLKNQIINLESKIDALASGLALAQPGSGAPAVLTAQDLSQNPLPPDMAGEEKGMNPAWYLVIAVASAAGIILAVWLYGENLFKK